jgi:polyhydroxybutyrate depolymerase
VVVLHGAFSSASGIAKVTRFSQLAEREGFIVAYPNGIGLFGLFKHWNAGHCCGKAVKAGIDDVAFLTEVIDQVSERVAIDRQRIYLVGYSNGGMLAYRFAAEQSRQIAACAVVSGSIGGQPTPKMDPYRIPEPATPVPILVLHGREDQSIPYDGAPARPAAVGVRESVDFWRQANHCRGPARVSELRLGSVVHEAWTCAEGPRVELVTIEGWGHDWPGRHFTTALAADDALYGFDAGELIWQFLREFRR